MTGFWKVSKPPDLLDHRVSSHDFEKWSVLITEKHSSDRVASTPRKTHVAPEQGDVNSRSMRLGRASATTPIDSRNKTLARMFNQVGL